MARKTSGKTPQKNTEAREPNAQNSELDPETHPSGARIERMKEDVDRAKGERDTAEGSRADVPEAPHRQTPESR
ncbi:MAG: hypothetical protein V4760_12830 [Bdellovibrionota bacterium]